MPIDNTAKSKPNTTTKPASAQKFTSQLGSLLDLSQWPKTDDTQRTVNLYRLESMTRAAIGIRGAAQLLEGSLIAESMDDEYRELSAMAAEGLLNLVIIAAQCLQDNLDSVTQHVGGGTNGN